ncbi:MAG: ABC transporter ATP-binding protein [Gammaproteobacteria bacterium]|nr:ABC transporter ATP-binding protein [Gammaproteobacteria bacterium]
MSEYLLQAEQLSRRFNHHTVVDDISFHVQRGQVMGFLGPNGAGKSTTMNMLSGNLAPSQGQITIAGFDLLDSPREAKAALGYLAENPPLYRELTVFEYLQFCARINQIPKAGVRAAMEMAMERCGLQEVSRRLIGNLSKGYQQRVGIAQAIIHLPQVVILDEPTVGLDPIQIREIRSLIRELGKEHAVILSTHILPEVQATCDQVQIINQGKMVFHDSIQGLEHRLQHNSLLVAFHHPPELADLQGLAGVERCDVLGNGQFRIHYKETSSPAEQLVARSVAQNWRLYELRPEQASLEDVFMELTHQEVTEPAA